MEFNAKRPWGWFGLIFKIGPIAAFKVFKWWLKEGR